MDWAWVRDLMEKAAPIGLGDAEFQAVFNRTCVHICLWGGMRPETVGPQTRNTTFVQAKLHGMLQHIFFLDLGCCWFHKPSAQTWRLQAMGPRAMWKTAGVWREKVGQQRSCRWPALHCWTNPFSLLITPPPYNKPYRGFLLLGGILVIGYPNNKLKYPNKQNCFRSQNHFLFSHIFGIFWNVIIPVDELQSFSEG